MERIARKFTSFAEAEQWDIEQQLAMTPMERRDAVKQLRLRVYGKAAPDVRQSELQTQQREP